MGYIGRGPVKSGAFRIIDDIASSFNGSTTGFTLQHNSSNLTPGTEQNLLVAVDGVMQEPVDAFTISGSTLTFTSAPASGASFWGVELGDVGGIASSVANGTVDTAQLAADAVDGTKIADEAIDSEHYVDGSIDLVHMSANSVDSNQYVDGSIDTVHIDDLQVTGAKIANDTITEGKLDVSNGPTNGQFLQAQSGEGGGLTWAAAGGTTYTTGSTNVHAVNDATTGVTLNNNYKFTMTMPSSGEGFFFKCADQGSEQSAVYYADYSSQITKIAGGSKWDVLDGGDTGGSGEGKYYVSSDVNSRVITIYNREGNNRTITVHGMGRLASVTAQASI